MILLRRKPSSPAASLVVTPTRVRVASRPMRVLDFDVECRPLDWYGGDLNSKEITAMAWAWVGSDDVQSILLGEATGPEMLRAFVAAYDAADVVTGHFIRGFDLPLINGALTEYQMPALSDKLSSDTKLDLVRRHGLSGSQENLGAMLGLTHPKVGMNQAKWRAANRLTRGGLEEARARVVGDVRQHMELRARLLQLGYLDAPKIWRSGSAPTETYTP